MNQEALRELISLFLSLNPQPSDEQFHQLAGAVGTDRETLESIAYAMLAEAEEELDDPLTAKLIHRINAAARLYAEEDDQEDSDQEVLEDPAIDPDDLNLNNVALNDGDPTDDDLGQQDETYDDGYTEIDTGIGLINDTTDVLTDDGVPDTALP